MRLTERSRFPDHNDTKDFQNWTKINRDMAKNGYSKNTYVCFFISNLAVKISKIFFKLSPWGM